MPRCTFFSSRESVFSVRRGQRPALLSCLCRSAGVPSAGEPLVPERGGPGQSPAGTPCLAFAPLVACGTERPSRPRGAGAEGTGAGRIRGSGVRCRAPGSARLPRQRPGCPTISKAGKKPPKLSKPPKLHFTPWFLSASAVGYGLYKSAGGEQKAPRWS